jgi:hypothetical protein
MSETRPAIFAQDGPTWNKAWVKKAVKELGEQHCDDEEQRR